MNTELGSSSFSTSECIVGSTGLVYTTTRFSGDPVMLFRAVLDRPAPNDVGMAGHDVIIIGGRADESAPRIADVRDARDEEWSRLLQAGTLGGAGDGSDVAQ